MRKLIYVMPLILLFISACGGMKAVNNSLKKYPQSREQAAKMKDYEFSYPDSYPNPDFEFEDEIIDPSQVKYKVAMLVPLSGKAQKIGQALLDAAQMAAFEKGDSNVAILPYDTASTAEGAADAAYTAIEEGANIILGPLYGSSARKVAPIARTAGVKVLSFSNDKTIAGNGVYILGLIPDQQIKRVLEYAETVGIRGVTTIIPNDVYGHGVKEIAKDFSKNSGITYRGGEVYSSTYPRYSKAVSGLVKIYSRQGIRTNSETEAVMVPQGGEALERILLAMDQKGLGSYDVTILGSSLWDRPETLSISELKNAYYASVPFENLENFSTKFMSSFGYRPEKIAALGYDAVDLAVQLSRDNFSNIAMHDQRGFVGVNGAYKFSSNGLSYRGYEVVEIRDGQISVVDSAPYF